VPLDARAFWVAAPGRGEIRTEPIAPPASGEVLVRTLFSGISRGTESLVFRGRVPPSEFERMRAPFQGGRFPAPVKYGYASVGEVEEGPPELKGRVVFTLYPHQTRYVVPVTAVHLLPANTPPNRAVLAANLETAINGVWDARPLVGDRVSIIGAGAVGCMTAWLVSRMPGCEVELVDKNPAREVVATASQEDVDVIGVSLLSGAHMALFPRIIDLMKEQEIFGEHLLLGGGVIPDEDVEELKQMGVDEIMGQDTPPDAIVDLVRSMVAERGVR